MGNSIQAFNNDLIQFLNQQKLLGLKGVSENVNFKNLESALNKSVPSNQSPQAENIFNNSIITKKEENYYLHEIKSCKICPRHKECTEPFPITINSETKAKGRKKVLVLLYAPNTQQDLEQKYFAGEEGTLLLKMLQAIGLTKADFHPSFVIKCRGKFDRKAKESELVSCSGYLEKEIKKFMDPNFKILCFGSRSVEFLIGRKLTKNDRAQFLQSSWGEIFATYSPDFLLKNTNFKKNAWSDLQIFQKKILPKGI